MRSLVIFLGLLALPTLASAQFMSQSIVDHCFTTSNPRGCIATFLAEERAYQLAAQQRALDAQMEQARIQAEGLALFGMGAAYINGMNQNFQNLQQPYVNTPYFTYDQTRK